MAEFKENIKKPLGRGLGSLLGESVIDDFKSKSLIGEKIEKIEVPRPEEIKITAPPIIQPQVQDHMRVWEIDIEKIIDVTPIPHNGVRPPKIRRV
jgi:hypothetical protein